MNNHNDDEVDVEHMLMTVHIKGIKIFAIFVPLILQNLIKNSFFLIILDAQIIPYDDLDICEEIGRGKFGIISRAKWNGKPVVVKLCEQMKLVEEFLTEVFR